MVAEKLEAMVKLGLVGIRHDGRHPVTVTVVATWAGVNRAATARGRRIHPNGSAVFSLPSSSLLSLLCGPRRT